jgi:hypothetical protein
VPIFDCEEVNMSKGYKRAPITLNVLGNWRITNAGGLIGQISNDNSRSLSPEDVKAFWAKVRHDES